MEGKGGFGIFSMSDGMEGNPSIHYLILGELSTGRKNGLARIDMRRNCSHFET